MAGKQEQVKKKKIWEDCIIQPKIAKLLVNISHQGEESSSVWQLKTTAHKSRKT